MSSNSSTTRRKFLQLASIASVMPAIAQASEESALRTTPEAESSTEAIPGSLLSLVNPMQGTNSTAEFSRGNTLPIVALPFGMAHWTLQSHDKPGWFFEPASHRLQGVRLTHQLSPWLGDYGYATFLPFCDQAAPDPDGRSSSYRALEMEISPATLNLFLTRYRCQIELSPTERCCIMRYTFARSGAAGLFIDLPGETASATYDAATGAVNALTHENRGGVQANFATYFHLKLDHAITGFRVEELKGRRVAVIQFQSMADKPIEAHIGTSFISHEQARLSLEREVGSKTFSNVAEEAASIWEHALARVRIQGRTENEHRTFYSCLYRTLLFPRIWHELNADEKMIHMSPYTGRVEPGLMYADHGFWDDYHAWYPMMLLLYPERLRDILQSWVNAYKEGGWIPQFPCPGYRGAMTGSPSDIIFGDAAAKGLTGFDLASAYEGLHKQATEVVRGSGFGRTALEPYLKLGYVPCDAGKAGVAETLDYLYGDFCIAQIAHVLGKEDDSRFFLMRSQNWKKLFDPQTKFFRGKLASGEWVESSNPSGRFDPFLWGGPYVEGGPWQYRFNLPFDPEGLMQAYGGKDAFVGELEDMFTAPPEFHVGSYKAEIHEMSEMAAVNFGQYDHGNQPGHNVLYLFTIAGHRDKTQYYAHRVLYELYSPDSFPGDEDTGSMSAWYILSALGLFAACPGDSKWTLGCPLFDSATVTHTDGSTLQIDAHHTLPATYLNQVTLNGSSTDGINVEHTNLKNAHLIFSAS